MVPEIIWEDQNKVASMNYIYAEYGVFCNLSNFDELKDDGLIQKYFVNKPFGAIISKIDSSSDRIGGFYVIADSEEELISKVKGVDQSVEVLDQNNKDIMLHGLYY